MKPGWKASISSLFCFISVCCLFMSRVGWCVWVRVCLHSCLVPSPSLSAQWCLQLFTPFPASWFDRETPNSVRRGADGLFGLLTRCAWTYHAGQILETSQKCQSPDCRLAGLSSHPEGLLLLLVGDMGTGTLSISIAAFPALVESRLKWANGKKPKQNR